MEGKGEMGGGAEVEGEGKGKGRGGEEGGGARGPAPLSQISGSAPVDYCNSLFFGMSEGLMSRLQSVQNAAAPESCRSRLACI